MFQTEQRKFGGGMICSTTTYNWVSNFQVGANIPLPLKRNPTHGYKVAHEVGYSMVSKNTFTMPTCYLAVKNHAVKCDLIAQNLCF